MQPTIIAPEMTVTPLAPLLSRILPTHIEPIPPIPDPIAKPMEIDVEVHPRSS